MRITEGFLFLALTGCALTTKAAPIENRYFSPEGATMRTRSGAVAAKPPVARLRLGRLTSSANLRSHIVRRESAFEVAPYETLRWTENPIEYVTRALTHSLFDDGRFEHVVGGAAPSLDVILVRFEEGLRGTRRTGHVEIQYRLHDERTVLASGTVEMEQDGATEGIEGTVAAIGAAMDAAAAEVADRVERALSSPRPRP